MDWCAVRLAKSLWALLWIGDWRNKSLKTWTFGLVRRKEETEIRKFHMKVDFSHFISKGINTAGLWKEHVKLLYPLTNPVHKFFFCPQDSSKKEKEKACPRSTLRNVWLRVILLNNNDRTDLDIYCDGQGLLQFTTASQEFASKKDRWWQRQFGAKISHILFSKKTNSTEVVRQTFRIQIWHAVSVRLKRQRKYIIPCARLSLEMEKANNWLLETSFLPEVSTKRVQRERRKIERTKSERLIPR